METDPRNPPQKQINIRDRQRPAMAIASRPRVGPSTLRSNTELHAIKSADRTATSRNCLNGQRRRDEPHACLLRFVLKLEPAIKPRHVGTRAAHVEANCSRKPGG